MYLHTPERNQGQIVKVSYASDPEGCGVYRRVLDQSDGHVSWGFVAWETLEDLGVDIGDACLYDELFSVDDLAWRACSPPTDD